MRRTKIQLIADCITEDPNITAPAEYILREWGEEATPTDPIDQQLSTMIDRAEVQRLTRSRRMAPEQAMQQALADIKLEFQSFMRNYRIKDQRQALMAFQHYKTHKQLPQNLTRDVGELDQQGGRDFRSGGW
jgi:hypothetical protein